MAKKKPEEPRNPAHKGLVDALIDHELDAKALVQEVLDAGVKTASKQMIAGFKKVFALLGAGKISASRAKQLFREIEQTVLLAEFSKHAHKVVKLVDTSHERIKGEQKKLGRPLKEVSAIRDSDKMAREAERKPPPGDDGEGGGDA